MSESRKANNTQSWCTTFTWRPSKYANHSSPQAMRALIALKNIGGLQPGMDILDLGGGDGKNNALMAKQVFPGHVVYLDQSRPMAEMAYLSHKNHVNLSVIQSDAATFKFNYRFDLITSFFALQWVPAHLRPDVFTRIYNHLKEDGRLCIMIPCLDFPHIAIKAVAFSEKWKTYFSDYLEPQTFDGKEYYQPLLEKTGFSNIKIEMIESHHALTNQEFILYTEQWCGCYRCLPTAELRAEFIRDICTKLNEEKHQDGKFDMVQRSIQMVASKPTLELSNRVTLR